MASCQSEQRSSVMARMEKKPPPPSDLTMRILEQIRAQIGNLDTKLDHLTERVDHLTERVDGLDQTMKELAQQQRFIVRSFRTLAARDERFDRELADLRARLP
jgi:chromosome segregation ATPase